MIKLFGQRLGLFRQAEFLSPKDLLQRAGAISVLFLVAHLAGLREFTSVLNGTVGSVADGGRSFYVKGRHADTVPALWQAINETERR